jgi:DNA-binding NarL/FixJ family response regulator
MNKSRTLVVDSIPAFRAGIIWWLNGKPDLAGCGEADSPVSARTAMAELKPDLALVDLTLIDGEGLDLLREGAETRPDMLTLVITDLEEPAHAHRALRAGARGYLTKREPQEAVLAAIRAVLRGEIHVSRSLTVRLADRLFPDPASSIVELARLSDRELQVFRLLGSGSGTTEIVKELRLSAKTVAT